MRTRPLAVAIVGSAIASCRVGVRSSTPGASRTVQVEGHRGARALRPENTLSSFEHAIALGADVLELDLHLSADDVLVVWHDPVVVPEKCDVEPDPDDPDRWRVRALTVDQLQAIRCDRNPDRRRFPEQVAPAGEAFHIPTLDEALALSSTRPTLRFNLELKRKRDDPKAIDDDFDGVNPGTLERGLVETIHRHGLADRVTVQSFDHRSLWAVHALDPSLVLAALTVHEVPDFSELARRGATIWSPHQDAAAPARVRRAHAAGLRVIPWTVNEPRAIKRLIRRGVDGIISDRPDRVRAEVDRRARAVRPAGGARDAPDPDPG